MKKRQRKLTEFQTKALKMILADLRKQGSTNTCPANRRCGLNVLCKRLFPSLKATPYDQLVCPCDTITRGDLTLSYVIRRVAKALKDGMV